MSHAEREECLYGMYGERQDVEILLSMLFDRSIYPWESQCSNRSKSTKSDSSGRAKTLKVLSFCQVIAWTVLG
jgi:hypothetical protein